MTSTWMSKDAFGLGLRSVASFVVMIPPPNTQPSPITRPNKDYQAIMDRVLLKIFIVVFTSALGKDLIGLIQRQAKSSTLQPRMVWLPAQYSFPSARIMASYGLEHLRDYLVSFLNRLKLAPLHRQYF